MHTSCGQQPNCPTVTQTSPGLHCALLVQAAAGQPRSPCTQRRGPPSTVGTHWQFKEGSLQGVKQGFSPSTIGQVPPGTHPQVVGSKMSPEFWQLVVTHDPLQKVVPEGQPPR